MVYLKVYICYNLTICVFFRYNYLSENKGERMDIGKLENVANQLMANQDQAMNMVSTTGISITILAMSIAIAIAVFNRFV